MIGWLTSKLAKKIVAWTSALLVHSTSLTFSMNPNTKSAEHWICKVHFGICCVLLFFACISKYKGYIKGEKEKRIKKGKIKLFQFKRKIQAWKKMHEENSKNERNPPKGSERDGLKVNLNFIVVIWVWDSHNEPFHHKSHEKRVDNDMVTYSARCKSSTQWPIRENQQLQYSNITCKC